jgi:hypothetical protein
VSLGRLGTTCEVPNGLALRDQSTVNRQCFNGEQQT